MTYGKEELGRNEGKGEVGKVKEEEWREKLRRSKGGGRRRERKLQKNKQSLYFVEGDCSLDLGKEISLTDIRHQQCKGGGIGGEEEEENEEYEEEESG